METKDIKTAVIELLKAEGITTSVSAAGENLNRDGWQCDGWCITFTRAKISESFDYFTGLGHRKPTKCAMLQTGAKYPKNSVGYADWVKQYVRPVPPDIAGVLHSLISDSGAVTCFIDWANDYGYDSDSIKALAIYNACCINAKRLQQIFSRATLDELSELVQDY